MKPNPLRIFAEALGLKPLDDDIFFVDKEGKRYFPTKYGFITGEQYNAALLAEAHKRVKTENRMFKVKMKNQSEQIKGLQARLDEKPAYVVVNDNHDFGKTKRGTVLGLYRNKTLSSEEKLEKIIETINR